MRPFEITNVEDHGFYSDIYKDVTGNRPRHMNWAELEKWMEQNFTINDKNEIKEK